MRPWIIATPARDEHGVVHYVRRQINHRGGMDPPDMNRSYVELYCEIDDWGSFLGVESCGKLCPHALTEASSLATCLGCVTRLCQLGDSCVEKMPVREAP